MAMKDSYTESRSGNDILLQQIPDDLVVYRMVQHNPPVAYDFQSHYERGAPPTPGMPFKAFAWMGVSMFLDRTRAERLADTARQRGESAWIAELILRPGAGLWGVYNAKTTHLEVFGLPQDLLDRVDNVS
jgi:hypothetical protein